MTINLVLDCGYSSNGLNGCHILVNALQSYADDIRERGYAHNPGDTAQTLDGLLSISLSITEGFLSVSDKLGTYTESNVDGSYCDVYRPVPTHQSIGCKEAVTNSHI